MNTGFAMNSQQAYEYTVKYGQYFYPASKHYPHQQSPIVQCDRCNRTGLTSCIGWEECDLCLDCSTIVTQMIRQPPKNSIRPPQPISGGGVSAKGSDQGWCGTGGDTMNELHRQAYIRKHGKEPPSSTHKSGLITKMKAATFMQQSQFKTGNDKSIVRTNMHQSQFNPRNDKPIVRTMMHQSQFNPGNDKPIVRTRMHQSMFRGKPPQN